jgi:hypothetical protein
MVVAVTGADAGAPTRRGVEPAPALVGALATAEVDADAAAGAALVAAVAPVADASPGAADDASEPRMECLMIHACDDTLLSSMRCDGLRFSSRLMKSRASADTCDGKCRSTFMMRRYVCSGHVSRSQ